MFVSNALIAAARSTAVACCLGLLVVAGCHGDPDRPTLGQVHGRVTMDGKPLAKAHIRFEPKTKGRESFATTNDDGEYELIYLGTTKGAGVGQNLVRISTQRSNDQRTETVPARYNNAKTELQFEVKAGENEANFDLNSDKESSRN
jgi:hypothetical protein